MLVFLANLTWPLFLIGLVLIVVAGLAFIFAADSISRLEPLSDRWIIERKDAKHLLFAVLAGVLMFTLSFAAADLDEPLIRTVEKEVEVPVDPERTFIACVGEQKWREGTMTPEIAQACSKAANDVFLASTKGPIRVVEGEKEIVYTKIPVHEFMQGCTFPLNGGADGAEAIVAVERAQQRCSGLLADEMKDYVQ